MPLLCASIDLIRHPTITSTLDDDDVDFQFLLFTGTHTHTQQKIQPATKLAPNAIDSLFFFICRPSFFLSFWRSISNQPTGLARGVVVESIVMCVCVSVCVSVCKTGISDNEGFISLDYFEIEKNRVRSG